MKKRLLEFRDNQLKSFFQLLILKFLKNAKAKKISNGDIKKLLGIILTKLAKDGYIKSKKELSKVFGKLEIVLNRISEKEIDVVGDSLNEEGKPDKINDEQLSEKGELVEYVDGTYSLGDYLEFLNFELSADSIESHNDKKGLESFVDGPMFLSEFLERGNYYSLMQVYNSLLNQDAEDNEEQLSDIESEVDINDYLSFISNNSFFIGDYGVSNKDFNYYSEDYINVVGSLESLVLSQSVLERFELKDNPGSSISQFFVGGYNSEVDGSYVENGGDEKNPNPEVNVNISNYIIDFNILNVENGDRIDVELSSKESNLGPSNKSNVSYKIEGVVDNNFEYHSIGFSNEVMEVERNTKKESNSYNQDFNRKDNFNWENNESVEDNEIQPCLDVNFNPTKLSGNEYSLLDGGLEISVSKGDELVDAVFGVRGSNRNNSNQYETNDKEVSALLFKIFEDRGVFLGFEMDGNGTIQLRDVMGTRMYVEDSEGVGVEKISYNVVLRNTDTGELIEHVDVQSKLQGGNYVLDVIAEVKKSVSNIEGVSLEQVNNERKFGEVVAPEFGQLYGENGKKIRAYAMKELGFKTNGRDTILDQIINASKKTDSELELVTMDTVAHNVLKGEELTYVESIGGSLEQYTKLHPSVQSENVGILYLAFDNNGKVLGEVGYKKEGLGEIIGKDVRLIPVFYETGADLKGARMKQKSNNSRNFSEAQAA